MNYIGLLNREVIMERELLEILEKDSTVNVTDISKLLNVEEKEIAKKIKTMEKENIILGYNALVNWEQTDTEKVTAIIEVQVTPQRGEGFDKIAKRIYHFSEVSAVYLMSGGYDLTVKVEGATMKEVALFVAMKLSPLETVQSTATHFILKKYKDRGIIFDDKKKDERIKISL